MLSLDEVPSGVRDMVQAASKFAVADWQRFTAQWLVPFKQEAIILRQMGEEARHNLIRDDSGELSDLSEECRIEEDSTYLTIALCCLTDAQLDLMISIFEPEVRHKMGYLS